MSTTVTEQADSSTASDWEASRREKLRFETAIPGESLEAGGLGEAARAGVGALLAGLGIDSPADLAPALRLVYSRDRFVDPNSECRLSLDTEIAAVERAPWCAAHGHPAGAHRTLDVALVECKGPSRDLPAPVRLLEPRHVGGEVRRRTLLRGRRPQNRRGCAQGSRQRSS